MKEVYELPYHPQHKAATFLPLLSLLSGWDLAQPLHFYLARQLQVIICSLVVHALHHTTQMQAVAGSDNLPCRQETSFLG